MPLTPPKIVKAAKSAVNTVSNVAESALDAGVRAAGTAVSAGESVLRTVGNAELDLYRDPVGSTMKAVSYLDKTKDIPIPLVDDFESLARGKGFYDPNDTNPYTFRDLGNTLARPLERVPVVGPVLGEATRAVVDPLTLAGGAIKGTGLAANIIGAGTLTTRRYAAITAGAALAGATAGELGAPAGVQMAASLIGGTAADPALATSGIRAIRTARDPNYVYRAVTQDASWTMARDNARVASGRVESMLPWGQLDDDVTDPAVRELLGMEPLGALYESPDALIESLRAGREFGFEEGVRARVTKSGSRTYYELVFPDGRREAYNSVDKLVDGAGNYGLIGEKVRVETPDGPRPFLAREELDAIGPDGITLTNSTTGAQLSLNKDPEGFNAWDALTHKDYFWKTAEEAEEALAGLGYTRQGWSTVEGSVQYMDKSYKNMSDADLREEYTRANKRLYERMSAMDESLSGDVDTRTDFNTAPRAEALNDALSMEIGDNMSLRDGYNSKLYRDDKDLYTIWSQNRQLDGEQYASAGAAVSAAFPEKFALTNQVEQAQQLVFKATEEVRHLEEVMRQKGLINAPPSGAMEQVYRNLRLSNGALPSMNAIDDRQKAMASQAVRSDMLLHDNLQRSPLRTRGFDTARPAELKNYLRQLRGLANRYTPEYIEILDEVEMKIDRGTQWGDVTRGVEFVLYSIHDVLRDVTGALGGHDSPLLSMQFIGGGGGGTRPPLNLFGGFGNPFRRQGPLAGSQPIAPSYVAPLRNLSEVIPEVTVGGNLATRAVIGHTGINRNVLIDPEDHVKRIVEAAKRLSVDAETLTTVAIRGGIEPVSRTRVGIVFSRDVLKLDVDGNMRVASKSNPGIKGKVPFNEVAEHPDDFILDAAQEAFLRRAQRIIDDTFDMLAAKGLAPKTLDTGTRMYFPRQVSDIRELSLDRASNAWMSRVYETFIDAYANGINVADPVTALGLHVRAAYTHVINAELMEAIAPFAVKPSALIPLPITQRAAAAAKDYGDAMLRTRVAEAAYHDESLIQAATGVADPQKLADLHDILVRARQSQKLARTDHLVASGNRKASLEEARKATHAKGWLFGGGAEDVKIDLWKDGNLYREEYVKDMEDAISQYVVPEGIVGLGYKALNFQRQTATGFDFAAPFTHGFPVLGGDPVGWARATFRHYAAFFDPTMVANDMQKNLRWYQWMGRHGLAPTFTEVYQLSEQGAGFSLSKLDEVKIGQVTGKGLRRFLRQAGTQTYGRTGAAMELALMGYRRALVSSMWDTWKGTESELAEHIRAMTGAVNTRALGLSGGRRVLESMFLGLSPRLLRSTIAMVAELRYGLRDARGRAAAKSLTTMMGIVGGLYYTIGKIAGVDDEEITAGLNPLNGKRFLSYRIGDEWYGVGGQVRALTQMLAGVYAAASPTYSLNLPGVGNIGAGTERSVTDLWKLNPDNPILQFWLSRSAPGIAVGAATLEAAGGGNPVPFDDIDGAIDLGVHLGRNTLPFAIAGAFEERQWERNTPMGGVLGFAGLRTSPATPGEIRTEFLNGEALPMLHDAGIVPTTVTSVEALGPGEYDAARRYLKEKRPDLAAQWEEFRRDRDSVYQRVQDERREIDAKYATRYDSLYQELLAGTREPREVLASLKSVRDQQYGETTRLYSDDEYVRAVSELMPSDIRKVSDEWYKITKDAAGAKEYLTDADWEHVEIERERFLARMEPAERQRFERDLELRDSVVDAHPILKVKRAADAMSADYYDISEADPAGRTAYLKLHPEVDVARWFVYGGKLSSAAAVDLALAKQSTGPIAEALTKSNRDVLYANFRRPINDSPELWEDSKAAVEWYFGTVVPSGRSSSVLKKRGDLNGVLAFWGYDVKLHSTASKQYLTQFIENYTDWGSDGQWAEYGPTIMWWMNLTDAEMFGDPKKNKRGAVERRPDADAAYAWYRKSMFGVPPVLYSEAAKYYYNQFSGEDAENIPVRSY